MKTDTELLEAIEMLKEENKRLIQEKSELQEEIYDLRDHVRHMEYQLEEAKQTIWDMSE